MNDFSELCAMIDDLPKLPRSDKVAWIAGMLALKDVRQSRNVWELMKTKYPMEGTRNVVT